MLSGDDVSGFFVSSCHLSDEEYNFSQDVIDKKAEIELRKAKVKQNLQFQKLTPLNSKVSIRTCYDSDLE